MLIQLFNVSLSNLITVSSPEEAIWSLSQLTWFPQLFQSHTAKDNLEVDLSLYVERACTFHIGQNYIFFSHLHLWPVFLYF